MIAKNRCGICTLHHTVQTRCKATERTWPTAPLAAVVGGAAKLVDRLDLKVLPDEISDVQADRWATRLGLHPEQVWPGWLDEGLSVLDRMHLDSGWRQAWEWAS